MPVLEYELELFVASDAPRGARALRNLQALCAQYLAGRYTLAIVNLQKDPARAPRPTASSAYSCCTSGAPAWCAASWATSLTATGW